MTDAILRTENLKKSFGKLEVLKGITTEIRRGEVVSIIGPSGGGKSTFLRCLNLLETPDSGQVLFKGQDVTDKKLNIAKYRQSIGMVFQHFNVFPNMTVLENVTLAPVLEKLGIPPETAALLLIRPVSGSGALAVGSELMAAHGPDSYIGRCAAVMLGCTETTFYTIAVYFGAAGIRRTRYTIPAALTADLAGFMAAAWSVRLFFGA